MSPSPKDATTVLVKDLAAATAECTALMNEQFLALITNDPDIARFNKNIAEAISRRNAAMDDLVNHVQLYGW